MSDIQEVQPDQAVQPIQKTKHVHPVYASLILVLVALTLIAGFLWMGYRWQDEANRITESTSLTVNKALQEKLSPVPNGLGAEIYENASAPLSGKITEASPAIQDPVESLYKNPFN